MGDVFECDTVVIGAGVVGLACAAAMARQGRDVFILEDSLSIGSGTSSRNSEVIHAGIYYPTGSLKHLLCIEGRHELYRYAARRGIAHKQVGKLIVATTAAEADSLVVLKRRASENGVTGLSVLSSEAAIALEPHLQCELALMSAETGIIDSHGFMVSLLAEAEDHGANLVYATPVVRGAILTDGRFRLDLGDADRTVIVCKLLVNAAGHGAIPFAGALEGYDQDNIPMAWLAKGSYFNCTSRPFSHLIYPAPVDGGLGVHATVDLGGGVRFGPDVEWLDQAEADHVDLAVDPRRGDEFYAAIRRYWPGLPDGALSPDYAGLRPKLSGPGQPAADFRIEGPEHHGHPGLIHLFGIESPGLTASLAIAQMVCRAALY